MFFLEGLYEWLYNSRKQGPNKKSSIVVGLDVLLMNGICWWWSGLGEQIGPENGEILHVSRLANIFSDTAWIEMFVEDSRRWNNAQDGLIVSKRDVSILSAVCSYSFGYHGAIFLQRFGAPEMRENMRRRSYFEDPIHHVAGGVSGQELCGTCRKICQCILSSSMHLNLSVCILYRNIHTVNTWFFMYPDLSLSLSVLNPFPVSSGHFLGFAPQRRLSDAEINGVLLSSVNSMTFLVWKPNRMFS